MKTCPKCSLVHDDSVAKCPYCGYEFITNEKPQEEIPSTQPEVQTNEVNDNFEQPQNDVYSPSNQQNQNFNPNRPVKYCPYCGNQCDPLAVICVKCGRQFTPVTPPIEDKPSGWIKFACFLIPLLGLILYITEKDRKPISAKAYGKMALISFIIGIVMYVLWFIIIIAFGIFAGSTTYEYSYEDPDFYYSMIRNLWFMFK